MTAVDTAAALDFLRANHRAVMATTKADGSTQMSPITVGVDADGRVVVSTRETAYKVRHLRACPTPPSAPSPTGSSAVDPGRGAGEIVPLPEAMEPLVDYYRSISGEHPDWDDYRAAMERDRRVILRMTVERAGPDARADPPSRQAGAPPAARSRRWSRSPQVEHLEAEALRPRRLRRRAQAVRHLGRRPRRGSRSSAGSRPMASARRP